VYELCGDLTESLECQLYNLVGTNKKEQTKALCELASTVLSNPYNPYATEHIYKVTPSTSININMHIDSALLETTRSSLPFFRIIFYEEHEWTSFRLVLSVIHETLANSSLKKFCTICWKRVMIKNTLGYYHSAPNCSSL
jgi:hypothetical protein